MYVLLSPHEPSHPFVSQVFLLILRQGLVTSAQKVNRKAILQKYKEDVGRVYAG